MLGDERAEKCALNRLDCISLVICHVCSNEQVLINHVVGNQNSTNKCVSVKIRLLIHEDSLIFK